MRKAFTLAEILIVIGIIGIIAAIVLPEFQSHTQKAKEAAAKDNLRILRVAIELYTAQHNGIPPGYLGGDPSGPVSGLSFYSQMVGNGDYLSEIPVNPLTGERGLTVIPDADVFPEPPVFDVHPGWLYQAATKTIKLNIEGIDSNGVAYSDY